MTVIIVGSGPLSAEIRGADIDAHTVVRMWNCEWQSSERYGSRYDYGLITRIEDAEKAVRLPTQSWFLYNVPHEPLSAQLNGIAVTHWNHIPWLKKARSMNARTYGKAFKFTRGFVAVAQTIHHLRPKRIVIVGMDVLRNGATSAKYYDIEALPYYVSKHPRLAAGLPHWADDEMPPGRDYLGPHDFKVEAALVRSLAAETGTALDWRSA